MMSENEYPAVVITGAGSGIGAACALSLDQLGWRVFAGVHTAEDDKMLKQRASARLTSFVIEVTDPASVERAVQSVTTALGESKLAGLINCAGVVVVGPLECLPLSEIAAQLAVNVVGLIAVTQAFLPLLRQSQGRIVLIGSLAGKLAFPFMGPYAASKFAVEALADAWRAELRPWQIQVSLIEPDAIATPIWTKIASRARRNFTPEAAHLYGPILPYFEDVTTHAATKGLSTDHVTKAVVHALQATRPKTRYIVTKPILALLISLLMKLPDRTRDRLLTGRFPTYP
jgi:NAD(P)-dependent dehydrogenase (short-subunit alcohol dehydrogenase family)